MCMTELWPSAILVACPAYRRGELRESSFTFCRTPCCKMEETSGMLLSSCLTVQASLSSSELFLVACQHSNIFRCPAPLIGSGAIERRSLCPFGHSCSTPCLLASVCDVADLRRCLLECGT